MKRRQFTAGLGTLACIGSSGCKKDPPPPASPAPTANKPQTSRFEPDETQALQAALQRLLPGTHGAPDADSAGVLPYIEAQLQTPGLAPFEPLIRSGGRALNAGARKQYKVRWFADLSVPQQDLVMAGFQTGTLRLARFDTARFFEVLRTLALEGFLGHPRHGGNTDQKTWAWLGLVAPQCK